MVALPIHTFEDIRLARAWARDLALTAGVQNLAAVEMATAELALNCVEHGDRPPCMMWMTCDEGRLSLRFENDCRRQPDWNTRKPLTVAEFRTGGYGLRIARAMAHSVRWIWSDGRVVVHAEFV